MRRRLMAIFANLTLLIGILGMAALTLGCFRELRVGRETELFWPDGTSAETTFRGIDVGHRGIISCGRWSHGNYRYAEFDEIDELIAARLPRPKDRSTSRWIGNNETRRSWTKESVIWPVWVSAGMGKYFGYTDNEYLSVPLWIPILPGCVVAALWTAKRIKLNAYRRHEGHCGVCGYDLHATPDRCPECGTMPAI